jgi:SMC interacting uncharacterized protein involved in chromosome segregation
MPRIYLSIEDDLFDLISKDAEELNTTVNVRIVNILEGMYKQNPFDYQKAIDKIINEIQQMNNGEEFTLTQLKSFSEISIARSENAKIKPNIARAKLGKQINGLVRAGHLPGVKRQNTITKNGETRLKFINRAAVYVIDRNEI